MRQIFYTAVMVLGCTTMAKAQLANTIHLEAEDAQLTGVQVLAERAGFSGRGYVGDFKDDNAHIVWKIENAKAGLYRAIIRYRADSDKGYVLKVNDAKISGMMPASGDKFAAHDGGKIELQQGTNSITIERGWGYYQIDALDLKPAAPPVALKSVTAAPVDKKATAQARSLLKYLSAQYGKFTLSGQYEAPDIEYIKQKTGRTPAIYGADLMDFSPSRIAHGAKPEAIIPEVLAQARDHIITLSWHWNAPSGLLDKTYTDEKGKEINALWYRGFYTEATTFDLQKALADKHSPEYAQLLHDIDAIAVPLKTLQRAGVPVLWRPLHEAQGGWFWWGAKGSEPLKELWRILYDRLTNTHKLHNLIWVFTDGGDANWYPGAQYVDIVGIDAYPEDVSDPLSGTWEPLLARFNGRKMLALSEIGGVPDIAKMRRYGVRWSYFASWTNDLGPKKMSDEALKRIYLDKSVINSGELPDRLTK